LVVGKLMWTMTNLDLIKKISRRLVWVFIVPLILVLLLTGMQIPSYSMVKNTILLYNVVWSLTKLKYVMMETIGSSMILNISVLMEFVLRRMGRGQGSIRWWNHRCRRWCSNRRSRWSQVGGIFDCGIFDLVDKLRNY
jgi:hypothetical protein